MPESTRRGCGMVKGMADESRILAVETAFFSALVAGRTDTLDHLLAADFKLIDLTGALITKPELISAIAWGNLSFESIDPLESEVRSYGSMAVVTGQTKVAGQFGGMAFDAASRYTHIYVEVDGGHQLVAVQGTPILSE